MQTRYFVPPREGSTVYEAYRIAGDRVVEYRNYFDVELANRLSRGDVAPRAGAAEPEAEQDALRRMATLVASGCDQAEVFDAIVAETAELFGEDTWLLRYEADYAVTIVAVTGDEDLGELAAGAVSGNEQLAWWLASGRTARDGTPPVLNASDAQARRWSDVAGAVAPLLVQGGVWGALMLVSRESPLSTGMEERLSQFAELAATAVANAQFRADLQLLADEQSALRRVAELVARGAPTQEVFDQVTDEASRLLGETHTELLRYERSGTEVVNVAQSRTPESERPDPRFGPGSRSPVVGDLGRTQVWRTGRAARIDNYRGITGAEWISPAVQAAVLSPIVVERGLWGVLIATSPGPPLPAGTEERLTRFCELIAAAIANADSRADLTASRARIVASGDEARRRLARDVHDGAQQRLVHAIVMLKQAQAALEPTAGPAAALVGDSLDQVQAANEQLRDLAHGIMPAALARGGLRAAVESLRAHLALRVDAEVLADRLAERLELTAYFVISEALTNVVKHAGAGRARVRAVLNAGRLRVEVSDDGQGGADPAAGSGLVGLADRVDAAGGTMSLTSPPGVGTTLSIALPIDLPESAGPDARTG